MSIDQTTIDTITAIPAGATQESRLAKLEARDISAWFGDHKVLDRVSLHDATRRGHRAHRPVRLRQVHVPAHPQPDARADAVGLARRRGAARRQRHLRPASGSSPTPAAPIGMVFQKPNPFPAMSIYDNVLAGLRLTGIKARTAARGRARRDVPDQGRALERGPGPARAAGRRPLRRPAAAAVHRPVAGRRAPGAAHGRAVLGARPDVDARDRADDRRARSTR